MSVFELWLVMTVIPNLHAILTAGGLTGTAIIGMWLFISVIEFREKSNKSLTKWLMVFIAMLLIGIILPSKKDMGMIYGWNYISNNEQIKQLFENYIK